MGWRNYAQMQAYNQQQAANRAARGIPPRTSFLPPGVGQPRDAATTAAARTNFSRAVAPFFSNRGADAPWNQPGPLRPVAPSPVAPSPFQAIPGVLSQGIQNILSPEETGNAYEAWKAGGRRGPRPAGT